MARDVRAYRVAGIRVVSVTECLQIAGLTDFSGIDPEVLEKARQRGSEVHAWLEMSNGGLLDGVEPDEEIAGYIAAYERFIRESGWKLWNAEKVVVNVLYRYAGTYDQVGTMNGERWLIDIKATAAVAPESALQTAAYQAAMEEPCKRRGVLQLRPDGSYRLVSQSSRNDWHDFQAALRVACWKLAHGRASLED